LAVLTIPVKVYAGPERKIIARLVSHIERLCEDLKVVLASAVLTDRKWVRIEVSGEDQEFTIELLKRELGTAIDSFENLVEGSVITGRIVDSGKIGYGLYVETGSSQVGDALYPLHEMRRQLAGERKLSAKSIISTFCLYDNLPVEVRIDKLDRSTRKIWVSLTQRQMEILKRPSNDHLERLIVLGATRSAVVRSLVRSSHTQDIIEIETLGFLEHRMVCKAGTQARGLIPEVGLFLRQARLFVMGEARVHNFNV